MSESYLEPKEIELLEQAAANPRDRALVALLARTGVRISEATQLKESDVDFKLGTLTIVHLKERVKLKCPHCKEILGKKSLFCSHCGGKVEQAVREKIEQRRQRTIPVDLWTLQLLDEYLKWRRQYSYRGELVFPFTRQRGWQLVERLGRRAGIEGLHPHALRHFLATQWVAKGLDTKKLQLMLGHRNINTTFGYVDASPAQLKAEYDRLWETEDEEITDE